MVCERSRPKGTQELLRRRSRKAAAPRWWACRADAPVGGARGSLAGRGGDGGGSWLFWLLPYRPLKPASHRPGRVGR